MTMVIIILQLYSEMFLYTGSSLYTGDSMSRHIQPHADG